MTEYTIQVEDVVAETIQKEARRQKISDAQYASRLLEQHHQELLQFPDGVLREGRKKLIALLSQIPGFSDFDSSGVGFRYWWVQFHVDETSPVAARILQKLAHLLNTDSVEMMLPVVFKPMPPRPDDGPMRWEIASTAPRLDPSDVEAWLRDKLPHPVSDPQAWDRNS